MTGAWGDDGRDDLPEVEERATAPTKRFFYTDPLAAAWQAKHFGMYFLADRRSRRMTRAVLRIAGSTNGQFYIHPDSLRMLEPQVGDVYYNSCNGSYHEVTEKGPPKLIEGSCEIHWRYSGCKPDDITLSTARGWWNAGDTHDRIIRGGIVFHWPESEDV
jgi:hypothetical protein